MGIFRPKSPFVSKTVRDRPVVTTWSIRVTCDDFEWAWKARREGPSFSGVGYLFSARLFLIKSDQIQRSKSRTICGGRCVKRILITFDLGECWSRSVCCSELTLLLYDCRTKRISNTVVTAKWKPLQSYDPWAQTTTPVVYYLPFRRAV